MRSTRPHLFGPEFLIKRPLLQAVTYTGPGRPVLLIDELDRADEEFEAFLLELLSDFQITVPEVGTFRPAQPPAVVITSNRTREIHDALKRRCLYHWIEYPTFEKELAVLAARLPARRRAPGRCRWSPWCSSCAAWTSTSCPAWPRPSTGRRRCWRWNSRPSPCRVVTDTLGALLKHQEDIERLQGATLNKSLQHAQPPPPVSRGAESGSRSLVTGG